jgi:hypothetical protein
MFRRAYLLSCSRRFAFSGNSGSSNSKRVLDSAPMTCYGQSTGRSQRSAQNCLTVTSSDLSRDLNGPSSAAVIYGTSGDQDGDFKRIGLRRVFYSKAGSKLPFGCL